MNFFIMYEKELMELANSKAKYLVVGAVAIGLHGHPRATFDLDILPYLDQENLDKIIKTLTKLGYHPRQQIKLEDIKDPEIRKYWHDKKNLVALSFIKPKEPYNTIDLLLYQPIDFRECFERRDYVTIRGKKIYIASVKDLLELKRLSNRDKDKNDIIVLERMLKGRSK